MEVTAEGVRSLRFSGTRHVYDRREVDGFLIRLADALEAYERELAAGRRRVQSLEQALQAARYRVDVSVDDDRDSPAAGEETDAAAEAAAIRRDAEREADEIVARARAAAEALVSGETEPAAGTPADPDGVRFEGTTRWIQLLEETEGAASSVDAARQEAKRILEIAEELAIESTAQAARDQEAVAAALAAQMEADRVAAERVAAELVEEAETEGREIVAMAIDEANEASARMLEEAERQAARASEAAQRDATELVGDARVEGEAIVEEARRLAAQATENAQREVRAMERRIRQIRSSLRDAESRFESLSASTMAEFSFLGDLVELDVAPQEIEEEEPEEVAAEATGSSGDEDATPGFYERRLAGLRSRIEASEAGSSQL